MWIIIMLFLKTGRQSLSRPFTFFFWGTSDMSLHRYIPFKCPILCVICLNVNLLTPHSLNFNFAVVRYKGLKIWSKIFKKWSLPETIWTKGTYHESTLLFITKLVQSETHFSLRVHNKVETKQDDTRHK